MWAHSDCAAPCTNCPGRARYTGGSCWPEPVWRAPRVARCTRCRRLGRVRALAPLAVPAALLARRPPRRPASERRTYRPSRRRPVLAAHALPGDATNVRVAMTENDGLDVIVAASAAACPCPACASAAAVRFHQTGGTWEVDTGRGVRALDRPVPSNQTTPTASPVGGGLLPCAWRRQPDGARHADGGLQLERQARTVNTLPLEQYVADTVPASRRRLGHPRWRRSPGSDWGFQELEAQAVAVAPMSWPPRRLRRLRRHLRPHLPDLPRHRVRDADDVAAANDTAGQVMVMPTAGRHHRYSSSTGGYTSSAAEESPFTPVPDDGDAVCVPGAATPTISWSAQVSDSTIQNTVAPDRHLRRTPPIDSNDPGEPFDFPLWTGSTSPIQGTVEHHHHSRGRILHRPRRLWRPLGSLLRGVHRRLATLDIQGQGWGHGIGMGQYGALGYAIGQDNGDGNFTYQQIVQPLLRTGGRCPRSPT